MVGHRPFPPEADSPPARKLKNIMYHVYILKSKKDGTRYVGLTEKNPIVRAKEHNQNKGAYTRGHQPWVLIHFETYSDKRDALKREKFLKSGQGRKWLDKGLDK